jgi:hypothetical protein
LAGDGGQHLFHQRIECELGGVTPPGPLFLAGVTFFFGGFCFLFFILILI